ncbi:Predicted PurR-regulated permease PerM [Thermomonospora echinospora]|uniref:Predicted PurR-regulated permease PerM n=1 Tax=Thermomonospora echinospora TaxID=1992 RepID=A0A1H6C878_9ACTN|nr:AI-2E family transporter [Thermomonospora echinospora]SEG69103.1 Predicted PurR-regulated permease PerM [Thermomonospora echinospora]
MPSHPDTPPPATPPPATPRSSPTVPAGLRNAAVTVACLLVLAAALYLLVYLLGRLAPLTLAVVAALLMAALVSPVSAKLRRLHAPGWLAALGGVLTLLGAVALPLTLITEQVVGQWSGLSEQVTRGLHRFRELLVNGPLPISERQLDAAIEGLIRTVREAAPSPIRGAGAAVEVLTAVLLSLLLLFFLLKDGREMTRWALNLAPRRHRQRLEAAAVEGWRTLVAYIRGTFVIAAVDATGIGLALLLLGVPLALPLALLTFIAAFVPIVGATVAGAIAVLVALVGKGVTAALLTLVAVIGVQQAEGHLLQPLIMGRALRLHPAVILVAVTAGTLLGGIPGALVAVPITAITYRVTLTLRALRTTDHPTEPPPKASEPAPAPKATKSEPAPAPAPTGLAQDPAEQPRQDPGDKALQPGKSHRTTDAHHDDPEHR